MLSVPPQGVRAVARVPGTARALFGCMDGKCYVLDLATGKLIRTVERHTGSVMTVAVSSDGKTAASAGMDGWVRLWAVSDGSHTGRFYPAEWVKSLAFTPDGRRLLSCGHRGVIEVWDVASGKRVLDYRTPGDRPSEAWSLKLTRGGVLAAYADGKLREWRLPE